MQDDTRSPDGTFAPGHSGNPAGGGGNQKHWTPYANRIAQLMEKYTTQQILTMAEDKYALREMPHPMDASAILHIARTIDKSLTETASGSDDVRGERKELLDRVEGQSKSTTQFQNPDGTNFQGVTVSVIGVEPKGDAG